MPKGGISASVARTSIFQSAYLAAFKRLRGKGFGLGVFNAVHRRVWEGFLQPDWMEIEGFRLHLQNHDEAISTAVRLEEEYEPELVRAFKDRIAPKMTVVDLGANIGFYTLLASRLVGPDGHVLAFEPDVHNLALLSKNVEANGARNIEIYPYAVSDRIGVVELHVSPEHPSAHSIMHDPRSMDLERRRIMAVGLEEFFGTSFCPDVVKMDIEGAEPNAIRGLGRAIANKKLSTIFFECDPTILSASGATPEDIFSLLRSHGFALHPLGKRDMMAIR